MTFVNHVLNTENQGLMFILLININERMQVVSLRWFLISDLSKWICQCL